eukprot:6888310-Pyramimonas_sp.AAC.1
MRAGELAHILRRLPFRVKRHGVHLIGSSEGAVVLSSFQVNGVQQLLEIARNLLGISWKFLGNLLAWVKFPWLRLGPLLGPSRPDAALPPSRHVALSPSRH